MTDLRVILGNNVRKFRNVHSWSQQHLAELCNLSSVYITEIERGNKYPSPRTIGTFCAVFDVRPYQLFMDDADLLDLQSESVIEAVSDRLEAKMQTRMDEMLKKRGR